MKVSKRIEGLPPYLFVQISRKIAEKKAKARRQEAATDTAATGDANSD